MTVLVFESPGLQGEDPRDMTTMRCLRLLPLLALFAAGCATAPVPVEPHRIGATAYDYEWVQAPNIPAISGNNSSITMWSMTGGRAAVTGTYLTTVNRAAISIRCNQAVTILYQVERVSGGSVFRTLNGSGSGDAVTANTDTYKEYLIEGPNSQLVVTTGSTGPTACEVDIGLFVDRSVN